MYGRAPLSRGWNFRHYFFAILYSVNALLCTTTWIKAAHLYLTCAFWDPGQIYRRTLLTFYRCIRPSTGMQSSSQRARASFPEAMQKCPGILLQTRKHTRLFAISPSHAELLETTGWSWQRERQAQRSIRDWLVTSRDKFISGIPMGLMRMGNTKLTLVSWEWERAWEWLEGNDREWKHDRLYFPPRTSQ